MVTEAPTVESAAPLDVSDRLVRENSFHATVTQAPPPQQAKVEHVRLTGVPIRSRVTLCYRF